VGAELTRILMALLLERAQATAGVALDELTEAVVNRTIDPWTAAGQLLLPE
jgi:hypothetical protein